MYSFLEGWSSIVEGNGSELNPGEVGRGQPGSGRCSAEECGRGGKQREGGQILGWRGQMLWTVECDFMVSIPKEHLICTMGSLKVSQKEQNQCG